MPIDEFGGSGRAVDLGKTPRTWVKEDGGFWADRGHFAGGEQQIGAAPISYSIGDMRAQFGSDFDDQLAREQQSLDRFLSRDSVAEGLGRTSVSSANQAMVGARSGATGPRGGASPMAGYQQMGVDARTGIQQAGVQRTTEALQNQELMMAQARRPLDAHALWQDTLSRRYGGFVGDALDAAKRGFADQQRLREDKARERAAQVAAAGAAGGTLLSAGIDYLSNSGGGSDYGDGSYTSPDGNTVPQYNSTGWEENTGWSDKRLKNMLNESPIGKAALADAKDRGYNDADRRADEINAQLDYSNPFDPTEETLNRLRNARPSGRSQVRSDVLRQAMNTPLNVFEFKDSAQKEKDVPAGPIVGTDADSVSRGPWGDVLIREDPYSKHKYIDKGMGTGAAMAMSSEAVRAGDELAARMARIEKLLAMKSDELGRLPPPTTGDEGMRLPSSYDRRAGGVSAPMSAADRRADEINAQLDYSNPFDGSRADRRADEINAQLDYSNPFESDADRRVEEIMRKLHASNPFERGR